MGGRRVLLAQEIQHQRVHPLGRGQVVVAACLKRTSGRVFIEFGKCTQALWNSQRQACLFGQEAVASRADLEDGYAILHPQKMDAMG